MRFFFKLFLILASILGIIFPLIAPFLPPLRCCCGVPVLASVMMLFYPPPNLTLYWCRYRCGSSSPAWPPHLSLSISVPVCDSVSRLTASLFRGTGTKQSTLTRKPSGATSILIFLARHSYLYIGLY